MERSVLRDIPFFCLEEEAYDHRNRFTAIGTLNYLLERSGKFQNFRVQLLYPDDFPRKIHRVFDHEKIFKPGADGHLLTDYSLCLTLPERKEFSLGADRLTEEVLGATLIWFDKRLIYETTGEWPGLAERHGLLAKFDLILERAELQDNEFIKEWLIKLCSSSSQSSRYASIDVYMACPCNSGRKLKFCHGEVMRSLFKLVKGATLAQKAIGEKESGESL
jgi:hypothetical protein